MEAIRALYDRYQRIEIDYVGTRREVTPRVVRLISASSGTVIYSRLDDASADQTIREEVAYFKSLGVASKFEWKVFDYDAPADIKERLAAQGFVAEAPDAVLILDLEAIPPALLQPVTHDVRRITDPARLADVHSVLTQVWPGEDHQWLIESLATTLREKPQEMSVYAAYIDQTPASAGWIDFHEANPFAGLWGGSTVEAYRQRGLYTALVAARAQEAIRRGVRYLTIDASPMSRAVLEKFGFRLLAYAWECNYREAEQNAAG